MGSGGGGVVLFSVVSLFDKRGKKVCMGKEKLRCAVASRKEDSEVHPSSGDWVVEELAAQIGVNIGVNKLAGIKTSL